MREREAKNLRRRKQASSPLVEKLARTIRSPEQVKAEKAEAAVQRATDLIQLMTQAALLTAGFHTHHRQWRRKRKCLQKVRTNAERERLRCDSRKDAVTFDPHAGT